TYPTPYQWMASGPIWTITGWMSGKGSTSGSMSCSIKEDSGSSIGADHAAGVLPGQGEGVGAKPAFTLREKGPSHSPSHRAGCENPEPSRPRRVRGLDSGHGRGDAELATVGD